MIVILGGTVDGRNLFKRLQELGFPVVISVTSSYGGSLLAEDSSKVHAGSLDEEAMVNYLREKKASYLIDATHPFAVEASRTAMAAAGKTGAAYIRLERKREFIPRDPLVKTISSLTELNDYIKRGETVFSALGSKHLEELVSIANKKNARMIARVLPLPQVIEKCLKLGISPKDIVAMQGPFSRELNREMFRYYQAHLILSKESGQEGGQEEKIKAALDLGLKLIIWRRPEVGYPFCLSSLEEVCNYLLNDKHLQRHL